MLRMQEPLVCTETEPGRTFKCAADSREKGVDSTILAARRQGESSAVMLALQVLDRSWNLDQHCKEKTCSTTRKGPWTKEQAAEEADSDDRAELLLARGVISTGTCYSPLALRRRAATRSARYQSVSRPRGADCCWGTSHRSKFQMDLDLSCLRRVRVEKCLLVRQGAGAAGEAPARPGASAPWRRAGAADVARGELPRPFSWSQQPSAAGGCWSSVLS